MGETSQAVVMIFNNEILLVVFTELYAPTKALSVS